MSCQLRLSSHINDLKAARRYLFACQKEAFTEDTVTGDWGDYDWDFKEDVQEGENEETVLQCWLQECHISISPVGDLIAVANGDRIVHFAQKWDSHEEDAQMKYSIMFQGCLAQGASEKITSILCLPLASQKRSTHGGPDWTCVIVGFSSGYVRMYTETGALLLAQIFGEEPVLRLKCHTYTPPRHSADCETHEELNILYGMSLVTVDGFSLFQSLKACRNQAARARASGTEFLPPPPIAYKKWSFTEQQQVTDHTPCGVVSPNPFDQMHAKSVNVGSSAFSTTSNTASSLYLTVGSIPFVNFFCTGGGQPMLTDVAHAVASKLKSALFSQISTASGWLGIGRSHADSAAEQKRLKIEPASPLPARFGLYDQRRVGESIVPSPDSHLVATTDSFGRIILIDIRNGIAVRMWKGYRDAQVGWVEVMEDVSVAKDPRHALFLVIYAPRRGLLEVWALQHGPRVAAFNVRKCCRLICPSYGLMGLNNVTSAVCQPLANTVYLLDPDGSIMSLDIPFHLALSDRHSKRAHDMHLLKQLKLLLRDHVAENDNLHVQVVSILLDIKIPAIRMQAVERIFHTSYISVSFIKIVLDAVVGHLRALLAEQCEAGQTAADYDSRSLMQFSKSHQLLLGAYELLSQQNASTAGSQLAASSFAECAIKSMLLRTLADDAAEVEQLMVVVDKYHQVSAQSSARVCFACDMPASMTVVEFLGCFECHSTRDLTTDSSSGQPVPCAIVMPSLSEMKKKKLASFIFEPMLQVGTPERSLRQLHIPAHDLMQLLLCLCLSDSKLSLVDVERLQSLVTSLYSIRGVSQSDVSWWSSYRDACTQSQHVLSALIMALVGCSIVTESNLKTSGIVPESAAEVVSSAADYNSDLSDWESVVMEHEHWKVLVRQLEDLLAVQSLLLMKPAPGSFNKPPWESETLHITLKRVLDGGKGVIPEFVAKWVSGHAMPSSYLCLTSAEAGVSQNSLTGSQCSSAMMCRSLSVTSSPITKHLQYVQGRLPLTLSSDTLMANCVWEFMVIWNRDPEVTYALQQAIAYLRCIQNASLQHGVATMVWHMFIVKRLSSAAFLMEKIGKAPKDRLCRKDVGLSEVSLEKFMGHTVELLEVMAQARLDMHEMPVFLVEDIWQAVQGPTSLVELAVEQKEANNDLVEHHYVFCILLHAVLVFSLKSIKPLSLYDTKGKNALFKPLHSVQLLTFTVVDDAILEARSQFLCNVISHSVTAASDSNTAASCHPTGTAVHVKWPQLVLKVAPLLGVNVDFLMRHYVVELYTSGQDKIAEEMWLSVGSHAVIGSELLVIIGCRLAHFIFNCDPPGSVERLAKCSPAVSCWLQSMDVNRLRCANAQLSATARLVEHVVSRLPDNHTDYKLAVELVDLVHSFL